MFKDEILQKKKKNILVIFTNKKKSNGVLASVLST